MWERHPCLMPQGFGPRRERIEALDALPPLSGSSNDVIEVSFRSPLLSGFDFDPSHRFLPF